MGFAARFALPLPSSWTSYFLGSHFSTSATRGDNIGRVICEGVCFGVGFKGTPKGHHSFRGCSIWSPFLGRLLWTFSYHVNAWAEIRWPLFGLRSLTPVVCKERTSHTHTTPITARPVFVAHFCQAAVVIAKEACTLYGMQRQHRILTCMYRQMPAILLQVYVHTHKYV